MKKSIRFGMAALCLLALSGCTGLTQTDQRLLSGAAIGAGAGIATTVVTNGCVSCGAAIGTVVGIGAGYVVDQMNKQQ